METQRLRASMTCLTAHSLDLTAQGCLTAEPVPPPSGAQTLEQIPFHINIICSGNGPHPKPLPDLMAAPHTWTPGKAVILNPDSTQWPHTSCIHPCWVWLHREHLFLRWAASMGSSASSPRGTNSWRTHRRHVAACVLTISIIIVSPLWSKTFWEGKWRSSC